MTLCTHRFETKVWGEVAHIFNSEAAAVSLLRVKKGYRCSRHYHRYRVNQFTAVTCLVEIQWWDHYKRLHEERLAPGQTFVVGQGTLHRFRVIESGDMVEVYWRSSQHQPMRLDDIIRTDEGGEDRDDEGQKERAEDPNHC